MRYSREKLKRTLDHKGYKYFENGEYNLNIIGIRNSDTAGKVTNRFDDTITLWNEHLGKGLRDVPGLFLNL